MDPPRAPTRPVRLTRVSNRSVSYRDAFISQKRRRPTASNPRSKRRKTAMAASGTVAHEEEKGSELSISLSAENTSEITNELNAPPKVLSDEPLDEPLQPHQIFRFMDLPAELRLHIYRMALQRDTPLLLHLPRLTPGDNEAEGKLLENHITDRFPRGRHNATGKESVTPVILRLNQQIYKEARQILYGDNTFVLSLISGIHTLSHLHQRSRSLIKSVSLTIPNHHDILDNFADVVRLGLRYCWGLKNLTIVLPMLVPDGGYLHTTTSIYSNAFHILRWLPKGGKVQLEGTGVSKSIRQVVEEEGLLMAELDEMDYLKRQHQMPERH